MPNDLRGRTYATLIADVLISKAVKGDPKAIKEITDRVEGRVGEVRHIESDQPVEFVVVYADPIPKDPNRGIHSAQPRAEDIEAA